MPANVRMVLATNNTTNLEELAQLADQIMEVATPAIAAVSATTKVEQLRSEIADLKKMVQSLYTSNSSKSQHLSRSPPRRRSPSPS